MSRPEAAPVSQRSINRIFISAITALAISALPSLAYADGPAVSAINGKLSIEGGEINAHPAGIAIGSITAPLGFDFGGQADLGVGTSQGKRIWGVGGQLFARDPGIGLVGALASYNDRGVKRVTTASTITAANSGRVGAEAAYYGISSHPNFRSAISRPASNPAPSCALRSIFIRSTIWPSPPVATSIRANPSPCLASSTGRISAVSRA